MNSPHLDDERLSLALDNISGTPDDEAHLAGCRHCQARLDELAGVAQAVSAPVPARSPEEVDAAIQRALAATPASPAPTGAAGPVDLAERRPVRRWVGAVAAVAAVAAAAVVVAGLAVGLTRSGKSSRTVASSSGPTSSPTSSRLEPPGAAGPTGAIGRDLGDQSDPRELAALLTARLRDQLNAEKGASALSPTAPEPVPGVPAPPTTVGPSSGEQSTCLSSAVRAAGSPNAGPGVTRLIAPLRWRGHPALAFVFEREPPATGTVGLVLATSGCTLLSRLPM